MIIIGTISWNNLKFTQDFVKSLEKLDFNHYLMIWDNGSTDGTLDWLRETQNKWLDSDSNKNRTRFFEYNHSELNEGMPICWNWMLSKMDQNPFATQVWLCNNDIKFTKSMNQFPKFIEEHKEFGIITPNMIPREIPDEYIDEFAEEHANGTSDNAIKIHDMNGPLMGISKNTFKKVGFMDEKFKFSFEDLDYNERCKKLNLNSCVYHGCSVWHHQGASTSKNPIKIEENPYYKLFQEKHG